MDTKGLMLKRTILVQLLEAFASKRATKELGYYLTVTSLDKIGEGKIREQHTGERGMTFKIFKGEILEGVVHEVLRHGVFMRCVPVENVYLSHVNMPDYKYLPGENPTRRCLGFRMMMKMVLKLRVCDARQAYGGDCDNDFPKDFREDDEWNAFAFLWTLLESIAWHRVRQKINEEWIANTGDCPAVLCRKGKALDISFDHKYTFEQEERQVGYLGWYFEASIFTVNSLYKFSWRPVNKKVLTHR
ncbi:hypothetical protein Bca101_081579 [Brassica carinata]